MPRRPTGAAAKGRPGTMSKKAKAKANGVVKQRGPAKVIPLPKTGKGKAKALDADQGSAAGGSEDETDEELLDAEDMVGAGMSSSDEEEEGDEEDSGAEEGTRKSKANASGASSSSTAKTRGLQPDTGFLRSLDVNAISTSRAEEKRLKKEENKRQLAELRAAAKLVGKGKKPSLVKIESRSKEEGESGSEDYDFDSEDDNLTLSDLDEDQDLSGSELDFDSDEDLEEEDSEEEDSEDEEELEDRIAKQVADKAKRKRIEEQQKDSASAKKQKLPVRGENGWLQDEDSDNGEDAQAEASGSRVTKSAVALDDDEDDSEEEQAPAVQERKSNVETGARFGMMAPYSIMEIASRPTRLAAAREQIARLAQNILSDPEAGGIGFLRRIAIFAKVNMPKPSHMVEGDVEGKGKRAAEADDEEGKEAIPIDAGIRAAAILSLMAVYSDILPGYRIRPLTDAELTEKVSQDVQRRRDFEQGIVNAYREYLELCEKIVKGRKELSPIALKALTTMLLRAPHFNYRTNIIRTLVARLSRSSWDEECANCASALIRILREDLNGEVSLEIVRLLHRMIKERHYKAHPFVLDILLHLRLKEELGDKRASTTSATTGSNGHIGANRKAKPSQIRKGEAQHLSKREVKKAREMKEIEKEMREADATVDLAERERNQTETLKLLFVLYFSILKSETASSALLGSALEGLAVFAHRINVDFFRDLLAVLREHVKRARAASQSRNNRGNGAEADEDAPASRRDLRDALLCLVTAFELLSGQGEALTIDLSDLASHLYGCILQVGMTTDLEEAPQKPQHGRAAPNSKDTHLRSTADLLFRALELLLLRPRASSVASERAAAFAKRLLSCCLHWPAVSTIRSLRMIKVMLGRDAKLAALFDSADRARDGRYDALAAAESENVDAARPLACGESAWELVVLRKSSNADVRQEVANLLAAAADSLRS